MYQVCSGTHWFTECCQMPTKYLLGSIHFLGLLPADTHRKGADVSGDSFPSLLFALGCSRPSNWSRRCAAWTLSRHRLINISMSAQQRGPTFHAAPVNPWYSHSCKPVLLEHVLARMLLVPDVCNWALLLPAASVTVNSSDGSNHKSGSCSESARQQHAAATL